MDRIIKDTTIMKSGRFWLISVFCFMVFALLSGCGSQNEDSGSLNAEVVKMTLKDNLIRTGEKTVMAVDFTFSANALSSEGEHVIVAVKLPPEVRYEEGTSEIDGIFADRKVSPQYKGCAQTGELFLIFDLDWSDLIGASNPDGDGDARLTMTLSGQQSISVTTIESKAQSNFLSVSCDGPFVPDMSAQVSIL